MLQRGDIQLIYAGVYEVWDACQVCPVHIVLLFIKMTPLRKAWFAAACRMYGDRVLHTGGHNVIYKEDPHCITVLSCHSVAQKASMHEDEADLLRTVATNMAASK